MTRSFLLPALLLAAAPAAAQRLDDLPVSTATGIRLERYDFGDAAQAGLARASLLTLPIAAETRAPRGIRITLAGAYARGTVRRADGSESTLSGLTDTELRVAVPVAGHWLTASAVAVLPTGKQRLSASELDVAAVVSSDLLPFAISQWGTGGGLGGSLAMSRRFGTVGVGLAAGYRASRGYRAFDGEEAAYRPGDERSLRVAVDRSYGRGKATLQANVLRYTNDRLDGGALYRSGNRYQVIGSYAVPGPGRTSGVVYAGVLHRRNGAPLADLQADLPAQNLFLAGAGARLAIGRGALLPSADARVFRSADGVGQGYGVGVGASAEVPLGRTTLVPSARLRRGRVVVREGMESPLSGVEVAFTIRRARDGR